LNADRPAKWVSTMASKLESKGIELTLIRVWPKTLDSSTLIAISETNLVLEYEVRCFSEKEESLANVKCVD
jgi:hypothetical protein